MIKVKEHKCLGTGLAKGYGCGKLVKYRKYGLGLSECKCYSNWLYNSPAGKSLLEKSVIKAKKKVFNERKKETRELKKSLKRPNPKKDFYNSPAWWYCSHYVMLYYANSEGMVQCSTSGKWYQLPNKNICAGHYLKSNEHTGTAFEFKNLAPQSAWHNNKFGGKPEVMKEWLIKVHGEGVIDYLNEKKNMDYKLDAFEFEKWRAYYKKLFDELVKEKGFNPWKK
jgi:hypothetical protein